MHTDNELIARRAQQLMDRAKLDGKYEGAATMLFYAADRLYFGEVNSRAENQTSGIAAMPFTPTEVLERYVAQLPKQCSPDLQFICDRRVAAEVQTPFALDTPSGKLFACGDHYIDMFIHEPFSDDDNRRIRERISHLFNMGSILHTLPDQMLALLHDAPTYGYCESVLRNASGAYVSTGLRSHRAQGMDLGDMVREYVQIPILCERSIARELLAVPYVEGNLRTVRCKIGDVPLYIVHDFKML